MKTRRISIAVSGFVAGAVLGAVLAVTLTTQAAWSDPSQAPPNGGGIKVGAGTQAAGDCASGTDGGKLEYNSTTGVLYVCDGQTTTWDQLTN